MDSLISFFAAAVVAGKPLLFATLGEILTEKVFHNETNDGETLHKLEEAIVIEANAFALLVNNQPIAYFKDSKESSCTLSPTTRCHVL